MIWLFYGIIGFTILSGITAVVLVAFGPDEDHQTDDWWRDV